MREAWLLVVLVGCARRQHEVVEPVPSALWSGDLTANFTDSAIVHASAVGSLETAQALLFGIWLPFAIGLLFAALWTHSHRRRAEREQVAAEMRALRDGPAVIQGVVETDGGDAITVSVTQRKKVFKDKQGRVHEQWHERRREVAARPFRVLLDDGRGVRVIPDDKVHLRDEVEAPTSIDADHRLRRIRLVAGERVWVSGVLSEVRGDERAGAYREAVREPVMRRGLTRMIVSTEAPGAYHAQRASSHRGWFKGLVITLGIVHATLLYDVTLQALSGRRVDLEITQVGSWDVWVKPKNSPGRWVRHCAVWGRASRAEASEEREVSCTFHACAASGACRTLPTTRALLTADLLRDAGRGPTGHVAQLIIAGMIGWIALIAYATTMMTTRPWYAGGKVNH